MSSIREVKDADFNFEPAELNNPETRVAARGIVLDSNGKIAILNKQRNNEYKLVGGGVEGNEDPTVAFEREVLEEAGCKIEIDAFLGAVKEERTHNNFVQTSYVYVAHVIENIGRLDLTEKEIAEGSQLLWLDIDEAMERMKDSEDKLKGNEYENLYSKKFLVRRDYNILDYYKNVYLKK